MMPIRLHCQPNRRGRLFFAFVFLLAPAFLLVTVNTHAAQRPAAVAADAKVSAPAVAIPSSSFLRNFMGLDLVDQDGRIFHAEQLIDRIVLFNFIYTNCPMICPVQTSVLAEVMGNLPEDVRRSVRFVSVSIDPANDSVGRLKAFATQLHADRENWRFLTGDIRQIDMLAQRLHLFAEPQLITGPQLVSGPQLVTEPQLVTKSQSGGADRLPVHQSSIWLVDNEGRILQRYQGDPPDRDRLIKELSLISHLRFESRRKH